MSGDGSVVVGDCTAFASFGEALIWTLNEGTRSLQTVLEIDYDLDLLGLTITDATSISDDGTVIVGIGRDPNNIRLAWRADLKRSLAVAYPTDDALLVSGEPVTLRWTKPASIPTVDVFLLPDTLGLGGDPPPEPILLGDLVDADTLRWSPPSTLFSRAARIRIVDSQDDSVADTSAFFRLKPYHLARLTDDEAHYVPFDVTKHGWSFANSQNNMFPVGWWSLPPFNYFGGEDPFTEDDYDFNFPLPPINARPFVFPDWPSFVRAFGTDDTYWLLNPGGTNIYSESAKLDWGRLHSGAEWGGSCFGLSISSLMAFADRDRFGDRYPSLGAAEEINPIPINNAAREVINELFVQQHGVFTSETYNQSLPGSPLETLDALKENLLADAPSLARPLLFFDVQGCTPYSADGGHAVVPYRLERAGGVPGRWNVSIYDPNAPDDATRTVVIDSTAAGYTWSYAGIGTAGWGGSCGIFLGNSNANYFLEAVPPFLTAGVPSADHRRGEEPLVVAATSGAAVTLTAADGSGSIGYDGGAMFNTLPGALPEILAVGGPTPPIGYRVPRGAYSLTLSAAPDERVSATVVDTSGTSRLLYSYGRADAEPAQTDHLALGGPEGLTVRSKDAGAEKRIALRAIVTDGSGTEERERTLGVRDVRLVGADSVRFATVEAPDGPHLRLANLGGTKTYAVRLRSASSGEALVFEHTVAGLDPGAVHTVRPDWETLVTATLDIDRDGDGTPDESVVLANQVANEDAPETLPAGLALQVSPNPTAGRARIRYTLPGAAAVQVVVVDLLGRQVAEVVSGPREAGAHEEAIDGTGWPSGVYLVRLEAGGAVQTQRFTVVR